MRAQIRKYVTAIRDNNPIPGGVEGEGRAHDSK